MDALLRESTARVLLGLSILTVLLSVGLFYFNAEVLPAKLIIHFDAFRGVDFFGDATDVWWALALIIGMVGLNTALAAAFFYRERLGSYLLLGVSVLLGFLSLVFVSTILSVNG
jgi:hypothetical protein